MVRKAIDNPPQPTKGRGEDTYVQVSWEQALKPIRQSNTIAFRKANGPSAIFAGSYGWRSSGVLHKAQTLLQRYMNGGRLFRHSGDYSTGAAQVIMPHVVGSVEVYEQQTLRR